MRGWRRESISARSSSTRSALDPADRRVYTDGQCRPPQNGRPFLCPEDIMSQPLMPHATASWLVDNTALTFEQIAAFCGLHILEVQAIADDAAATKLTGRDPVRAGELTSAEIEKGQANPNSQLAMLKGPDQIRNRQSAG